jgi:hypothetical protein
LMSAGVCWTWDKSAALAAPMTRVACPGAPGWTMTGCASVLPVRQAAVVRATKRRAEAPRLEVPKSGEAYYA